MHLKQFAVLVIVVFIGRPAEYNRGRGASAEPRIYDNIRYLTQVSSKSIF